MLEKLLEEAGKTGAMKTHLSNGVTLAHGNNRSEIYYQVWCDGKPYGKGRHFLDLHGAWAQVARIAGRIGFKQARSRIDVMKIDEISPRMPDPQSQFWPEKLP